MRKRNWRRVLSLILSATLLFGDTLTPFAKEPASAPDAQYVVSGSVSEDDAETEVTEEPEDAPEATDAPSEEPTATPSVGAVPTEEPSDAPADEPTDAPTDTPAPTDDADIDEEPTEEPTASPETEEPTPTPTESPSANQAATPTPVPEPDSGDDGDEKFPTGNLDPVFERTPEVVKRVVNSDGPYVVRVSPLPSEYVTPNLPELRSQNPYGSCWAFASMALADINLIHTGKMDDADMSELHLAYFFYNSVTDPLGGTEGDSTEPGTSGNNFLQNGGHVSYAANVLSTWSGAAAEEDYPYSDAKKVLANGLDSGDAFDDAAHLKNFYEVNINEDRDTAKRLIKDNGAIAISLFVYDSIGGATNASVYNSENNCYYDPHDHGGTNHAVTVVGWDDDFPASNFASNPGKNGAWLVRNSWMDGGEYGDSSSMCYSGYFWLSYYNVNTDDAAYSAVYDTADNYDNNYQYDGGGFSYITGYSDEVYAANVFEAKAFDDGEILEAVSFSTPNANCAYTIKVYTFDSSDINGNPAGGTLRSTVSGTTTCGGLYTVELTDYVPLDKGTTFSVVVDLKEPSEVVYIDYECSNSGQYYNFKTSAKAGQSFLSWNGESWSDFGSSRNGNLRIKAYTTNCTEDIDPTGLDFVYDESFTADEGLTIGKGEDYRVGYSVTPNNCTDKSVTWKSSNTGVATVTPKGVVTGVGYGSATITCTTARGSISKSFTVTVVDKLVSISVSTENDYLSKTQTLQCSVTTNPSDYETDSAVNWRSSDESVLTVDSNGLVTGIGVGTAKIYAELEGKEAYVELTCYPLAPSPVASVDENSVIIIRWTAIKDAEKYLVKQNGETKATITAEDGKTEYSYTNTDYTGATENANITFYVYAVESGYSMGCSVRAKVGPVYTIKYHVGEGTNSPDNPGIYRSGDYIWLENPTLPTGYYFSGWYTDSGYSTRKYYISSSDTGNLDLYAKYTPNSYTIKYDNNGGTGTMSSTSATYDTAVSLRKNSFTKSGSTFSGWNTKADGSGIAYADQASVKNLTAVKNGTVTLYAQWGAADYTVTFNANGGTLTGETSKTVTYGKAYGDLPVPTRDGYDFQGWYTAATGGTCITKDSIVSITASTTLYAHWTASVYTVTLYPNGGTLAGETSRDVIYGATYGDLPKPARGGYTFAGWYTAAIGGAEIKSGTKVTSTANHSLYAHWTANTYKVTFNVNGGTVDTASKTVTYDSTYGELPVATKTGEVFAGWFTAATGGTEVRSTTIVSTAGDHTLYAHWDKTAYTVTLDANAEDDAVTVSPESFSVHYRDKYGDGLPATLSRTGYEFTGWFTAATGGQMVTPDSTVNIAASHTLYAHWTAKAYKVSFDTNASAGQTVDLSDAEKSVEYGSAYGELPVPVSAGYDFDGWYTESDGGSEVEATDLYKSASDTTLYAHWTKLYTVTVMLDGSSMDGLSGTVFSVRSDSNVTYEALFISNGIDFNDHKPAANPYKANYVFAGWYTDADGGEAFDFTAEITADTWIYALFESSYGRLVLTSESINLREDAQDGKIYEDSKITLTAKDSEGNAVSDAKIYYSLTGPDNADWTLYTGAINASALVQPDMDAEYAVKVYAKAERTGYSDSEVSTFTYTMVPENSLWGDVLEADRPANAADVPAGIWVTGSYDETAYNGSRPYTGSSITLDFTAGKADISAESKVRVYNGKTLLTYGADYTVSYKNNKNPGTATVTITGKGNYSGSVSFDFEITKGAENEATILLSKAKINGLISKMPYTGGQIVQDVSLTYNGESLKEGVDYALVYSDNTFAGTAVMTFTGMGIYYGTVTKTFTITGVNISSCFVDGLTPSFVYDGQEKKQEGAVLYTNKNMAVELTKDTDYTVTYTNNINAGTATVTYTGMGGYTGSLKKTYKIVAYDLGADNDNFITISYAEEVPYVKNGAKPKVTVKFDGTELVEGRDYTLTYKNNTKQYLLAEGDEGFAAAKAPSFVIKGKGSFSGTAAAKYFTVIGSDISGMDIVAADKVYTNKAGNFAATVTIKDTDGKVLAAGTDYEKVFKYYYVEATDLANGESRTADEEVHADDIVPVGTKLRVVVTGCGNYIGEAATPSEISAVYRIVESDLVKSSVTVADQYYTGREIRPGSDDIVIKLAGRILSDEDYRIVSYANNVNKGTGTITIEGIGVYGGSKTVSFRIMDRAMGCSVIFKGNGATAGTMKLLAVNKDQCQLTKNSFVRDGFVFAGWNTRPDGNGIYYGDKEIILKDTLTVGEPLVLYAQWDAKHYYITYHLNGGSNNDRNVKTAYTAGDEGYTLYAPEREKWPVGFYFGGWFKDVNYKNPISGIRKGTTGDMDLYALWGPYAYTVTFDGNGATAGAMKDMAMTFGGQKALTANSFKRDGYVFAGWNTDSDATDVMYEDKQSVSDLVARRNDSGGEVTLYAVWRNEFSISYETNGGELPADYITEYAYSKTAAYALPTPAKDGYSFAGWYKDAALKTKMANIAKGTSGDLMLYAKWTPLSTKVTFNGNRKDLGSMSVQTVVYGKETPLNKNAFVRKGYKFIGWSETAVEGAQIVYHDGDLFDHVPTKNGEPVVLYAQWEETDYTVTYETNGGSEVAPTTYNYSTVAVSTITDDETEKDRWIFDGWYSDVKLTKKVTEIAKGSYGDITLYAKWKFDQDVIAEQGEMQNKLYIDFNTCGGTLTNVVGYEKIEERYSFDYNPAAAIALPVPVRTGYTFAGWYKDSEYKTKLASVPKGSKEDLTLYAKWTGRNYKVAFNANAPEGCKATGTTAVQTLVNGTEKALNANKYVVKGYSFKGWNTQANGEGTFINNLAQVGFAEDLDASFAAADNWPAGSAAPTITLYAVWEKDLYTISYENADGAIWRAPRTTEYSVDSDTVILEEPEIMGRTFLGWYSDAKLTKKVASIPSGSAGNITLYAKWK